MRTHPAMPSASSPSASHRMHPAAPSASHAAVHATTHAAVHATTHAAAVPATSAASAASEHWGCNCERGRERTRERGHSEAAKESVVHRKTSSVESRRWTSRDDNGEEAKNARPLQMTKATDSDMEVRD